ncbi:MAG TPA: Gfo/Idh/MocA family oxidoreductase [Verrucomicrobiae bacterium]|nr:Gfo/Idh/MocA family oxidoreductase [Verrucomicrobiae bacterium]
MRIESSKIVRRQFIKTGLAASASLAAPAIIPARALGAAGKAPANNRINVALIGIGRQAYFANLPPFLAHPDTQVVALCDVDAWRLEQAAERVKTHYAKETGIDSWKGCFTHRDFREVLARKDVDAVMISTPDHWHAIMGIEAARAGKDVALEKPITMSVQEGRAISDAMKKFDRIFRVDSECRSYAYFRRQCELVRNGRIGKVRRVLAGVPKEQPPLKGTPDPMPVPDELDYAMWQGPAPERPYTELRVHPRKAGVGATGSKRPGWMCIQDYCDGMILNWGAHIIDIVQWGLGTEYTGPTEVGGKGTFPKDSMWDVLQNFEVTYRYADGTELLYTMAGRPFVRFEGEKGWIEVQWFKSMTAEPPELLRSQIGPNEIQLPKGSEKDDFIEGVKSRRPTVEPAEVGHRTSTICQIGLIAIRLGRRLKWDPVAEKFPGDDEANKLLVRPMRAPWTLPKA